MSGVKRPAIKRLCLFVSIVWRPWEDMRLSWSLAWEVALILYPWREYPEARQPGEGGGIAWREQC